MIKLMNLTYSVGWDEFLNEKKKCYLKKAKMKRKFIDGKNSISNKIFKI